MALGYVQLEIEYYSDPTDGKPVSNGFVYIGEPGLDPEVEINRITVTLIEEDGTQVPILPAAQPLTLGPGGRLIYNGSPVQATVDQNYSQKVTDSLGDQVYYIDTLSNTYTAAEITYDNAVSGLPSTDVQGAIDDLAAEEAIDIPYDNSGSGLPGTNVQDAIDDLVDSNNIDYDNSVSGLTATNVQDAIDELKTINTDPSVITFDNASFYIWQRATSFSEVSDNINVADRWQLGEENTLNDTTFVMSQQPNPDITGPVLSKYIAHIEFNIVTGGTNPFLAQRRYDPWFLSGKTVTMSFMIYNNSGATVSCQSRIMPDGISGTSKTNGTGFTIQAAVGWVQYDTEVTFPVYQNAAIVSSASNWIICPLHVPGIGADVDIEIADISIDFGTSAVNFTPKSYNDELDVCLPLYQFGGQGQTAGFVGDVIAAPGYLAHVPFTQKLRFMPNLVVTHLSTNGNGFAGTGVGTISNITISGYNETRIAVAFGSGSSFFSTWTADSETLGTGI